MVNEENNTLAGTTFLKSSGSDSAKIIEIYSDLLQTVWDKILPTLGIVTVMTITERAIAKTKKKFAFLDAVKVTENGLAFAAGMNVLSAQNDVNLKNGFKVLVCNLFDILAKLTGNILVNQLMREVEGIEIE